MLKHPDYDEHERLVYAHDPNSGQDAIIAVHSLALGPALGGVRFRAYPDVAAGLTDALRLSRAMSYKNALGGRPFGGAKAVILGDPASAKTDALLEWFGREVARQGGDYICAEDAGISPEDISVIARKTRHVRNIAADRGGPAPYTAYGVFIGILATVRQVLNSEPTGLTISVQGLGGVGYALCERLHRAGAKLIVSDIDSTRTDAAERDFGARVVSSADAHRVAADVFAPCAFGGILNEQSISELQAPVVAGAANNQLATAEDDLRLSRRGITYSPDYVINAGGIRATEAPGIRFDHEAALRRVEGIEETLLEVLSAAAATGTPTSAVADALARQRIGSGQRR